MKAIKIQDLTKDDILVCEYPNALIYCDKTRMESGDYKEFGCIVLSTCEISFNEKYAVNNYIVNRFADDAIRVKDIMLNSLKLNSLWVDATCNFYRLVQIGRPETKTKTIIINKKDNTRKEFLILSDFLKNYELVH